MGERPRYDSTTNRYWRGDYPLPNSCEEARATGLFYDPATDAWWNGDRLVAYSRAIDRAQKLQRDGYVEVVD